MTIRCSRVFDTFSSRLNKIRRARGMTKQEVGFVSGLDPAHISRMEGGKQRPMLDTIYRVAIALNCSTDYLLGLSDKQDLCIETVDKASQKD